MQKHLVLLIVFLLSACVSLHTPSPHFVPSLTKARQFEGDAAIGFRAVSVSAAYSPLNRLSVMVSAQALPLMNHMSQNQHNSELALGTYFPCRRFMFGFNLGYGWGAYSWNNTRFNDTAAYLPKTSNFQKLMGQAFLAFTNNVSHPAWFAGISVKENFYWDQYASLKSATLDNVDFSGLQKNSAFEACLFTRNFFTEKFYFNAQAGMNFYYMHAPLGPSQYMFARLGVGVKL